MEISYWQSRWRNDKTGWHMQQVFPLLQSYWHVLNLPKNAVVLVPLCGSSLDIQWLAGQGHYVIGVDVSEIAIKTLKQNHDEPFQKSTKAGLDRYASNSMELWCGDFLKLQKQWLPPVDAIYDKAAIIALPKEMRTRYAGSLQALMQPHTQVLINCFEYKQNEMPGPPFAVFENELQSLFGENFHIKMLHVHSLFDELTNFHPRGLKSYLDEKLYHLSPKKAFNFS
jgi:thiopurine S-methyltransferase